VVASRRLGGLWFRSVPSFGLAILRAIFHPKWLLGRLLGLMKGKRGDKATETAA
jgi:hypothetical protein